MAEKWSNNTVYTVNYHSVWYPKYRHAILEPTEDSLDECFRDTCEEYQPTRTTLPIHHDAPVQPCSGVFHPDHRRCWRSNLYLTFSTVAAGCRWN